MPKLTLLALLALLAACVNERTYFEPTAQQRFAKGPSDAGFSSGRLTGDLGPIQSFDDQRASVNGYAGDEFGGSSSVTVTGAAPAGTGFVIIDMYSLDLRSAPAGSYAASSAEMGDVGVIVCSDSHDGSIHFDGPAQDATVVIEDVDANTREVTVDSSIRDGYESMGELTTQSASFRIER